MANILIVGAGGVGAVVARKCAQADQFFSQITLASRTLSRCEHVRDQIRQLGGELSISQVDAGSVPEVIALLDRVRPDMLINVALPYQDLSLMQACLETGTNYLDTANYEPPDVARFEYKWQWDQNETFQQRNVMALLGCGFDPGVTNIFCAYARKHLFDEIHSIDILDCNAGQHGVPFATNFNAEINIREVTAKGRYWREGEWIETDPQELHCTFDFPEIGSRKAYLLYHEELESLVKNIPHLRQIRFWMTFSDEYLNFLRVLQSVGMTRIDPVEFEGRSIVPLKFLKALLPDPASLAENYRGKTCIGCMIEGIHDGRRRRVFIYNVCDHAEAFRDAGAQAISYTTGVPAMVGAMLVLDGRWFRPGVINVEELDPDAFLELLALNGLPWHVKEFDEPGLVSPAIVTSGFKSASGLFPPLVG